MSDQWFVTVPVDADGQSLSDDAKAYIESFYPGWAANDADLEVVLIDTLAPMAANAAEATSRVPPAVFRAFGTKLIGRAYDDGNQATAVVTFTLTDTLGHTIPADTEIDIDGFAFRTVSEVLVAPGLSTATGVAVMASDPGSDWNGLTGASVSLITALAWVASVAVTTPSSGGSDIENDEDYQNALSRSLLLQAKTLVTTRDFELWALEYDEIGRALSVHLGDRAVQVTVIKDDGTIVSTPTKNLLIADYANYRLVNTVVTLVDPTYSTISIAYTVKALPGFDPVDLKARIDTMLALLLNPGNWAAPKFGDPGVTTGWINEPYVRRLVIADRIGDVEGVDYVYMVNISSTTNVGLSTFTANSTNGSPVLTNVSSMANIQLGYRITGAGTPVSPAHVLSIDSPTQITLTQNMTATATGTVFTPVIGGDVDGVNQRTLIDFGGTVTGGTYALAITGLAGGGPTAAIQWNATGPQVVTALEALPAFEPGDIKYLSGGPGPTDILLEFAGRYAYRSLTVTAASSLTGTAPTVTPTTSQAAVGGSGDFLMPGTTALPLAGAMAGTVI